ncbi:AfsR/SARP family transcriptional regulator [Amycolatopsis azurea]|uniref:Regulatory protein n=1 Tax=Amycolatopsis azurea DSM 43854 TaxID=1238180 RepID=M2QJS9_9PSEU|nr:AfsR/SARP family transcriptional regulator [Amycolatopsis azurea]EMD26152.1 regulatory protein [Amycolatopsis azurea DSM 43854]OOC01401.1 transcriptional regulator [Amycolatopsis azurea DSM 43854]
MLQFRLLGPLEIVLPDGRILEPSSEKMCKILGILLLRNEVSSVDVLTRELWDDNPPRSALTTLQTYVYHTRRMFDQACETGEEKPSLVTRPPGYELKVPAEQVDTKVFERSVAKGRELLGEGDAEEAGSILRQGLALWRGPALANVDAGDVLRGHISHLEELRIRALELRIEADRARGQRRDLIPELRSLVVSYPLNEWFHSQLINELHHGGRRAEALQAYQDLRRILNDELGLEPMAEIRRLHRDLLASTA